MTAIFVLTDGLAIAPDVLESHLEAVVGSRSPIRRVAQVADLQEQLPPDKKAVVFFSAPAETALELIESCRSMKPGTAFVLITEPEQLVDKAEAELDCHLLRQPFDSVELLSRFNAANRQSELLYTLADCSQTDEVTNLHNRRYYIQRLSKEISLSRRHLSPLCCVVIGVNLYQMYLDSYGYGFINALLRFLADKISGIVRHEDIVARIGDDEIAVLLSRSTEKGAKIFTTRLVHDLNAAIFKYGTYEEEVSVCAGVAGYPLPDFPGADADTVIRYARHALHQAKTSADETKKVQLFSEIRPAL